MPLLDVDRPAGPRRRLQEVGLARQEGRDLEQVDHLGDRPGLDRLMDVGGHGQAGLGLDALERPHPLLEARPAEARRGCPVGLVERGLEDQGDAAVAAELGQPGGDPQRHAAGLHHAGAGDQSQRASLAELHRADLHGVGRGHARLLSHSLVRGPWAAGPSSNPPAAWAADRLKAAAARELDGLAPHPIISRRPVAGERSPRGPVGVAGRYDHAQRRGEHIDGPIGRSASIASRDRARRGGCRRRPSAGVP